jgi:hypothetical protein
MFASPKCPNRHVLRQSRSQTGGLSIMPQTTSQAVIGVFDTYGQAERATDSLRHAGFAHEDIGVASPGEAIHPDRCPTAQLEHTAGEGAVTGAVTGSLVGAVAGALVLGLVPGLGTVIAGGLLAGIVGGAAAGAALGGFAGPFLALGLSSEKASQYENEIREGRTLVAVQAGNRAAEAGKILQRLGGNSIHPPPEHGDKAASAYSP